MPIKSDREYRSIPVFNIEKRDEGEAPSFFVEGYASTFDTYLLFEDPDGTKYQEHIDPHAFDNCDMSDVVFQRDHSGPVYARTSNGSIEVSIDGHGLHQRTDLGRTSGARQMFEDIQAGMYTQMSLPSRLTGLRSSTTGRTTRLPGRFYLSGNCTTSVLFHFPRTRTQISVYRRGRCSTERSRSRRRSAAE